MIWWFKKLQIILIVIGRHVKRYKETTTINGSAHLVGQKGRDDLMILALVYTLRSPSINAINAAHPCLFSLLSASTSSSISRKSSFGCPITAFQGKLIALVYASHTFNKRTKSPPLLRFTSLALNINIFWVPFQYFKHTMIEIMTRSCLSACFLVTNLPGAVHILCIKNMHAYFVYGFELRWNVGEFAAGLAPIHSG